MSQLLFCQGYENAINFPRKCDSTLQLSPRLPILFNMKACILLLALAVAVQAQKMDPVTCDWEKEMMCYGKWNEDWTEQISADYCIPQKNGDCWNQCPV